MNYKKACENLEVIYLHIGDGGIFTKPCAVQTVLGSCVSIMLINRKHMIGATFHAMLPDYHLHEKKGEIFSVYKYVNSAVDYLLKQFAKLEIGAGTLEAKLFGGADQIGMHSIGAGASNLRMAYKCIKEKRLRLVAEDVGGANGRKVVFCPHTGEVWIKKIATSIIFR